MQEGAYSYRSGFNWYAVGALLLGILPNIPGFLTTIGLVSPGTFPSWITGIYSYAWFVGFFVSGVSYFTMMHTYAADKSDIATNPVTYKEDINYVNTD
jgi:NCS1 family nucleobase:cation symporter-1